MTTGKKDRRAASPAIHEDTAKLRQSIIQACFTMRDQLRYFIATWGNISVRVEDGLLVTPTRMNYEVMHPDDLVVVGWDGKVLRGRRLPTSEAEMHRQILHRRADLGAIIHAHSPWASVCACAHRAIPVIVDDMAEIIGGEVRCAAHIPAGRHSEIGKAAAEAIGNDACAVLLGNHGVAVGGRDLEEAIAACQIVEKAAMVFVQAEAIGGARPIPETLWRDERHRYLYRYGTADDLPDLMPR